MADPSIYVNDPNFSSSSEEYWSIDGVSLHEYGWSVSTIGGPRYDVPTRRGENVQVVYRPGALHRAKTPDSRVITLVMWMQGVEPASGRPTGDQTLQWNDNWDFIRRLVWKYTGAQVDLTRRWRLTDPVTSEPHLLKATAKAELVNSMPPTMTGRHRADFVMDLLLADPYFYGDEVVIDIPMGSARTIYNPGHDMASHNHFTVQFHGPVTNALLTNTTLSLPVWMRYSNTVSSGNYADMNVGRYTAYTRPDNLNRISRIEHGGARHWMVLIPGNNVLTLQGSGSGYARVKFRPPYI